jgi:FtsH-binding integral membrane protein
MTMGLIGIIIAMLINLFLQSTALQLAISILGVVIFAGLTAWDTQRLRQEYYMLQGTEFAGKAVILGALSLYLDFVNMFQFLLSFLGNRE